MTRARSLSRLANSQAFTVDGDLDVGINSTSPSSKLDVGGDIIVSGVVTATSFIGDVTGNVDTATTSTYATTAGIATYADVVGIATYADVAGIATVAENLTGNPTISVTDITATGNVSIAGTLTYEDVTNVDSIGIITARSGIDVTGGDINVGTATTITDGDINVGTATTITDGGINVTGIITATSFSGSFSGDGSQLQGIESGERDFVASGNISNGDAVVINTDGTVSIATTSGSEFIGVAGTSIFHNGDTSDIVATYDSTTNKVIIIYKNSSNGYGIVGTVSGKSISFGNPSPSFETSNPQDLSVTYDSTNERVIVAYQDNGDSARGKVVVGRISGTSIAFVTGPNTFSSNSTSNISATYDSANQKVVIAYSDNGNSSRGTASVGTVSGDTISFGLQYVFESNSTSNISATYDSANQKVVIAYRDGNVSNSGTAIVGTVSGDTISFGTSVEFNSSATDNIEATYDSTNQKVVIAYRDNGNSNYGTAIVGTVSGTSISFGTPVVFESASSQYFSATYDSTNQKVVIAYQDTANSSYGTITTGTVSGTSISFGTPIVFESALIQDLSVTYNSANQKVVIAYADFSFDNYGTASVVTTVDFATNLNPENYIGIAAEAISDTATGKINIIGGVNSGQTGLTTGQTYYVRDDGSLSTNPSTDQGIFAGTSISSTEIIVKG